MEKEQIEKIIDDFGWDEFMNLVNVDSSNIFDDILKEFKQDLITYFHARINWKYDPKWPDVVAMRYYDINDLSHPNCKHIINDGNIEILNIWDMIANISEYDDDSHDEYYRKNIAKIFWNKNMKYRAHYKLPLFHYGQKLKNIIEFEIS